MLLQKNEYYLGFAAAVLKERKVYIMAGPELTQEERSIEYSHFFYKPLGKVDPELLETMKKVRWIRKKLLLYSREMRS